MAQRSPSTPSLFFGITNTENNMEFMANSQHYHHVVDPMNQSDQFEVSYPDADDAIRVSPNTLLDANRHVCELCDKGFVRKQNLVLHQRAHNLPFTLKTNTSKDPVPRKVYLCPEPTCARYNRSHALGDFGGLRKHYLRKHCNKKDYKCDKCCKAYSVEADLKAHLKSCGNRKCTCHCAVCYSRQYCGAREQLGAEKYPQTLNIGDSSISSTRNDDNNNGISSVMSPLPMFGMGDYSIGLNFSENNYNPLGPQLCGMGDNSIGLNFNENNYNPLGPQLSTLQNQSNSYHSIVPYHYHSSQFLEDHGNVMTDSSMGLNMGNNLPNFFSSSLTHLNEHEYQMKTDMDFYEDLLRNDIPLDGVYHQNVNMIGDGGTNYGTGESSNLFANGSMMYDSSSSLNLTPPMHTTSQNGMLYPESGINDVGGYGNGGYYGYDYGQGSGQFGFGDGTEVHDFETLATTSQAVAPSEPHFNQHGFWY